MQKSEDEVYSEFWENLQDAGIVYCLNCKTLLPEHLPYENNSSNIDPILLPLCEDCYQKYCRDENDT